MDGKAVFVPGAIPGETVDIQISQDGRSFMRAVLLEIIEASPERVEPECIYYPRCQGCAYQHVSYEAELEFKRQVLEQQLKRIARIDYTVPPVLAEEECRAYRNKVEWQLFMNESGSASMGYVSLEEQSAFPVNHCLLLKPSVSRLSSALQRKAGLMFMSGVRRVGIRWSELEQSLMLNLFGPNPLNAGIIVKDLQDCLGGVKSVNLISPRGIEAAIGDGCIFEEAAGFRLKISELSFFQVNMKQAERLFQLIFELAALTGKEKVLDAYCGTGVMAMVLAGKAAEVLGIDSDAAAIDDAAVNAAVNKFDNSSFIHGSCEHVMPGINEPYDLLVLDPPRAGCRPEVLQAALKMNPSRIIYVSCNPATLARDLKILAAGGFQPDVIQALDMFPRTWHLECVVRLHKH